MLRKSALCISRKSVGRSVGSSHDFQPSHHLFHRRQGQQDDREDGFRKNIAQIVQGGSPQSGHISAEGSNIFGIENEAGNLMKEETAEHADDIALEQAVFGFVEKSG